MTAWELYWLTRLDSINELFIFVFIITLILCVIGMMNNSLVRITSEVDGAEDLVN